MSCCGTPRVPYSAACRLAGTPLILMTPARRRSDLRGSTAIHYSRMTLLRRPSCTTSRLLMRWSMAAGTALSLAGALSGISKLSRKSFAKAPQSLPISSLPSSDNFVIDRTCLWRSGYMRCRSLSPTVSSPTSTGRRAETRYVPAVACCLVRNDTGHAIPRYPVFLFSCEQVKGREWHSRWLQAQWTWGGLGERVGR